MRFCCFSSSTNPLNISPKNIQTGDVIILKGDIGRHGIAIMAEREGLQFEHKIESDCAPLNGAVKYIIETGADIHCMRDLTRGGLSSALNELVNVFGERNYDRRITGTCK